MSLVGRYSSLRLRIQEYGLRKTADKQAEAFRRRASELAALRDLVAKDLERVRVLSLRGTPLGKGPPGSAALSALTAYRQALETPDLDSGQQYGVVKRTLGKFQRDVAAQVANALKRIGDDLPAMDEVFLREVERIPGFQSKVAQIRQAVANLRGGVQLDKMSPTELDAFLTQRDTLRGLADDLKPGEFPKEVLQFFAAIRTTSGAPIERLTDSVRQWLADRDLLKLLRLTIVSR